MFSLKCNRGVSLSMEVSKCSVNQPEQGTPFPLSMEVGESSVNQPGLDPVGGAWKGLHSLAQLCPMRLRTEKMLEFATTCDHASSHEQLFSSQRVSR